MHNEMQLLFAGGGDTHFIVFFPEALIRIHNLQRLGCISRQDQNLRNWHGAPLKSQVFAVVTTLIMVNEKPAACERGAGLSARAALKPIQMHDGIAGIPQPSRNVFDLKRPISRTEVAIQQLGYLFSAARFLDLVQGSPDVFVKAGICVRRLSHLPFLATKTKPTTAGQRFMAAPLIKEDAGLKRNLLEATEQSICGLPPVHVLRQYRPECTSAQIHWDPRLAFPNSHRPAIQKWRLASPPVGRSMRVRCWP